FEAEHVEPALYPAERIVFVRAEPDLRNAKAAGAERETDRPRREVHEMPRHVEMHPVATAHSRLPARDVREAEQERAARPHARREMREPRRDATSVQRAEDPRRQPAVAAVTRRVVAIERLRDRIGAREAAPRAAQQAELLIGDVIADTARDQRLVDAPADRARGHRWGRGVVALALFVATAAFVAWRNSDIGVLVDISYVLNTATRIALGDVPYSQ